MNILVITDNYPSKYRNSSGVFVYNLVTHLRNRGIRVYVICPEPVFSIFKRKTALESRYNVDVSRPFVFSVGRKKLFGFNTHYLTHFFYECSIRYSLFLLGLRGFSFDIVYSHFIWNFFFTIRINELRKVPNFVGVGESHAIKEIFDLYGSYYFTKNLSRATIISVSELNKKTLIDLGLDGNNIHVIRNGVDTSVFHRNYSKHELRQKYGFSQQDIIISYVGRNTVLKGNEELREIVHRINAQYVIIGPGFAEFSSRVIFNGVCNSSLVAEYLAISDIFFFPTHHEGSPNALIEALCIGLPVVCTDLPELREICDVKNGIFIKKGDINGFEISLRLLIGNEGYRNSMSNYRPFETDRTFDIERRVDLLLRVFLTGKL